MRTNVKNRSNLKTHEGAPAKIIDAEAQLRRTLLACMLWENNFYEDGVSIADRLKLLVPQVDPNTVAALAIAARHGFHLRHAPLLLVRELARQSYKGTAETMAMVIDRADELAEFLSLYWSEGKTPLSAQVKKGLAKAFTKFDGYQLAKYNRDNAIKLRDVLFLSHAKPKDDTQAAIWKQLVEGNLSTPDTWETNLSAGKDKKETFTRLLQDNKLGYMALLRNLRNMKEAGVSKDLVSGRLMEGAAKSQALPFRFIAAARAVPGWEQMIDKAMQLAMTNQKKLPGKTVLLVDVSSSMGAHLSGKSELTRVDAAIGLAILIAGVAEDYEVYTFDNQVHEIPQRQGMALGDAIRKTYGGWTLLGAAVKRMNKIKSDRLIVITDEQSGDKVGDPVGKGYMINVASYENGVGYGKWTHIDGFSEAVIDWVREYES